MNKKHIWRYNGYKLPKYDEYNEDKHIHPRSSIPRWPYQDSNNQTTDPTVKENFEVRESDSSYAMDPHHQISSKISWMWKAMAWHFKMVGKKSVNNSISNKIFLQQTWEVKTFPPKIKGKFITCRPTQYEMLRESFKQNTNYRVKLKL